MSFRREEGRPINVPLIWAGLAVVNSPVTVTRNKKTLTEGLVRFDDDVPSFEGLKLPKTKQNLKFSLIPEQFQEGDRIHFPSIPPTRLEQDMEHRPRGWKRQRWDVLA
ncbi:MAG TPA: hypothetical protein VHC20_07295 [Candidatus Paceibacterota bacterium]|nr:hypothetical protein [Candidatus Paceibacterota bacterium]